MLLITCGPHVLLTFILKLNYSLYVSFVQVIAAKSEDEIEILKGDGVLFDSLVNAGWLDGISIKNRDLAIQTLMVHFILQKRKVPLDQLCKGLNTLGILKLVKSHPEQMQKYFIKQDMPLKSEDVIGLLTIDRDELPLNDKSSVAHNFLLQGIKKLEQGVLLYFHNIIYFQLTI